MLPEQERTVDYVIEKIKMYENREKEENQNFFRCGKQGHFQYECTSQGNVKNSWRGSIGEGQQQARGGAYYKQHQQRGGNSHSRVNGGYRGRGRGTGQRGRGEQQRQDRQNKHRGK